MVADACRDLTPGVTSSASAAANVMNVASLAGRRPNQWQYSEVVFLEPAATINGRTGSQPFVVAGYQDGVFTLDHDFGPAGIPQGVEFFLVRNHGQGNPYRAYLRALKRAVDNLNVATVLYDDSTYMVEDTYTYTVPAGLDSINRVTVYSADVAPLPFDLRPDQWQLLPGRQIQFTPDVYVNYLWRVGFYGRQFGVLPTELNGIITLDLDEAMDAAQEWLNRTSNRPIDQSKGQNLQAERIRFKRRYALPNERLVIP